MADATAVYARISRDPEGLMVGVDRQVYECRRLAEQRGWTNPIVYTDNDISATSGRHRPGYAALMSAIRRGEIARVVVFHPSRLWRNRRERADGIETMREHAVSLVCVKGPTIDMTTAYGRGMAALVGEFDTMESEVKSERVRAAIAQRARAGRLHAPGYRLFGYTPDGMTVVESEAAVVRWMFEQFLAGRSLGGIARDIGSHPNTVRQRLKNPRYAGIRVYEGQEYPAAWPAIVDRATWEAACRILADPARSINKGPRTKKYLGSGYYQCERCGGRKVYAALYVHSVHGTRRPIYRCRIEFGGCGRMWYRDRVDQFVTAAIRARLGDSDLADLVPKDRPDLDALRREAAGIRERLRTLAVDYVRLGLDEGQLAAAVQAGRDRLAEIERVAGVSPADAVLGQLLAAEDPVALWDAIPPEHVDRRQAIARTLFTVTLGAPPRGRPPRDRDVVAWYAEHCVTLGPATG